MGFTVFALICSLLPFLIAGQKCQVTMGTIEGPYYKPNAPSRADQSVRDHTKVKNGTQLLVQGRIFNTGCTKNVEALLDIWTADPQGVYSPHDKDWTNYLCRGKLNSDANGNYKFLTVIPGRYGDEDGYRPAHIHFKVFAKGGNPKKEELMTMLYFLGDPDIPTDSCPVSKCHAGDPTITYPLVPQPDKSYQVRFDIVLGPQGQNYKDSDLYLYSH